MWTLPNLLSLFRILLVPFLAYLMSFTDPVSCALAALVFIIASVTDMLDGYLARRHKSVSDFGKILDPLADKLLVVTALIMLVAIDRPGDAYVPVWLVVIIVAREVAVTVLRGIALTEGIVIPADELGKYKLLVQTFALVGSDDPLSAISASISSSSGCIFSCCPPCSRCGPGWSTTSSFYGCCARDPCPPTPLASLRHSRESGNPGREEGKPMEIDMSRGMM